jgi:hypothetical protein
LMLASGVIVATSVPFCLKMLSTFMALSSCTPAHVGAAFAGVDAIILSGVERITPISMSKERYLAEGSLSRYLPHISSVS